MNASDIAALHGAINQQNALFQIIARLEAKVAQLEQKLSEGRAQ